MLSKFTKFIVGYLTMALLLSSSAWANPFNENYDHIQNKGVVVSSNIYQMLERQTESNPEPVSHGDLNVTVFRNSDDLFTYELTLDPFVNYVSVFNANYSADVTSAGYSFNDAISAMSINNVRATDLVIDPATAPAFDVYNYGNQISYTVTGALISDTTLGYTTPWEWTTQESITFFFQTKTALAEDAVYEMINSVSAYSAPAPVPEPATMMLFGIGLIGISGVFRKRNYFKLPI